MIIPIANALTLPEYETKFNKFIDRLWTIQDRISELKEFEKQWKAVFDRLKARTGKDCAITIQNDSVHRSFHWDRYQILLSDLLSIHENELNDQDPHTLLKQSLHHLRLLTPEEYIDQNFKVNFIHNPRHPMSAEERKLRTEELKTEDAKRTHKNKREAFRSLFPRINDKYEVTDTDIRHLLSKISSLAAEIREIRHYFNHKYEDQTVARYQGALKNFSLEKIEENTTRTFQIVSDLGLVLKNSSYAPSSFSYVPEISDQIDLILFGSIKSAIFHFYEVADKQDFYWQAREKYFESESFLEIINPTAS